MGSLYKQKNRDGTPGRVWWVKYRSATGRPVRESTQTDHKETARRFLLKRPRAVSRAGSRSCRARIASDTTKPPPICASTTRRRASAISSRWRSASSIWTRSSAATASRHLGGAEATAYVAQRQAAGAANGTINRELGVLRRCWGSPTSAASSCAARDPPLKRRRRAPGSSSGTPTSPSAHDCPRTSRSP